MIYASQERAQQVADMLNTRKGECPAYAIETPEGWSVICGWLGRRDLERKYGIRNR